MNNQTDPAKVVNANENHQFSWFTRYPEYTRHVPVANWLIKKYCTQWWKNHPESYDYRMTQFQICMELHYSRGSREFTLDFIAFHLKCNPFLVMNDNSPELKDVR